MNYSMSFSKKKPYPTSLNMEDISLYDNEKPRILIQRWRRIHIQQWAAKTSHEYIGFDFTHLFLGNYLYGSKIACRKKSTYTTNTMDIAIRESSKWNILLALTITSWSFGFYQKKGLI